MYPMDEVPLPMFSNGWLGGFKARQGIHEKAACRVIAQQRSEIAMILASCNYEDIYTRVINKDIFGRFARALEKKECKS